MKNAGMKEQPGVMNAKTAQRKKIPSSHYSLQELPWCSRVKYLISLHPNLSPPSHSKFLDSTVCQPTIEYITGYLTIFFCLIDSLLSF